METLHSSSGFGVELGNKRTVLKCGVLVHSGADGDALLIYDDYAEIAHMSVDSVECFLYFLRHLN